MSSMGSTFSTMYPQNGQKLYPSFSQATRPQYKQLVSGLCSRPKHPQLKEALPRFGGPFGRFGSIFFCGGFSEVSFFSLLCLVELRFFGDFEIDRSLKPVTVSCFSFLAFVTCDGFEAGTGSGVFFFPPGCVCAALFGVTATEGLVSIFSFGGSGGGMGAIVSPR